MTTLTAPDTSSDDRRVARRQALTVGSGAVAGIVAVGLPSAAGAASVTGATSPPLLPSQRPTKDLEVALLSSPRRVEIRWEHNPGTMPFTYTYTLSTYPEGGLESSAVVRATGTLSSVEPGGTRTLVWTNTTGVAQKVKVVYSSSTSPPYSEETGWNSLGA